jgi:hypothetical protein
MKRSLTYLNDLSLRAYVWLQIFAAQEPVRLRASLMSAVAAAGFLFPAVAQADITDSLVGVAVVALPLLVGESTRKKVSPVNE